MSKSPKFETRDVIAVLVLVVVGLALWIDHLKPLADWAKRVVDTAATLVFAYYFTASPQRGQVNAVQAPPAQPAAPTGTDAPPPAAAD